MRKLYLFALALSLFPFAGNSQNISGIVNTYHRVTAINTSTNQLTVTSSAGLSPGTRVLIIQMKGATIDQTNTASFGNVTTLSTAGNYEFNVVCGVSGNDVLMTYSMIKSFTVSGMVQIVSIPSYTSVTVTDTLKAAPWNSSTGTGGIVAIRATNSITLQAPVDAEGKGFTGGAYVDYPQPPYNCDWATNITNYSLSSPGSGFNTGGNKGEGITATVAAYQLGKGKLANGGGGANNHNAGGAGGANYGTGGAGGYRSGEGTFNCHGQNPGIGGLALSTYGYSGANNRVFLGGGGGAGHGNNNVGMSGASGGGIVFLMTDVLIGNGQLVRANGARPFNASFADPYSAGGDGGGGGGGGGVVVLDVNTYSGNVIVQANGGRGSDASYAPSPGCFGPGGGGGGGVVWVSNASVNPLVSTSVVGGANGIISATTSGSGCALQPNGATAGTNGAVVTSYSLPVGTNFICAPLKLRELIYFNGKEIENGAELSWKMSSVANIRHYYLERSVDNVRFETVTSIRNNNKLNFSFADANVPAEYVYYRLRVLYDNGSQAYSPTILVRLKVKEFQILRIGPNPASDKVKISLQAESPGSCEVCVYNQLGQQLHMQRQTLQAGVNSVSIDVKTLRAGTYFVVIRRGQQRIIQSFIIE